MLSGKCKGKKNIELGFSPSPDHSHSFSHFKYNAYIFIYVLWSGVMGSEMERDRNYSRKTLHDIFTIQHATSGYTFYMNIL